MNSRIVSLAVFLAVAFAQSPALAETRWTFCVAFALGTKDVWITEVFAASRDRDRFETELKSLLERTVHVSVVAQCPRPTGDRVAAVNAQTIAEEFNRKRGSALYSIPARDFPMGR